MIKLYGMGLSNNVSKVRYCLNKLGLEYEWEQTNPMQGENQTEEFLAISPGGKIPAIDIDGLKLFESAAIMRYLAASNNSSLYPEDQKQRAVVDSWLDFVSIHVFHAMGRVLFNRVFAPMMGAEADENSAKCGIEFLEKYLPRIDKQFGENKYLADDDLSIADLNLLAVLDPFELMKFDLSPYANIITWRKQLQQEDFYQKCYPNYAEFVQTAMAQMQS